MIYILNVPPLLNKLMFELAATLVTFSTESYSISTLRNELTEGLIKRAQDSYGAIDVMFKTSTFLWDLDIFELNMCLGTLSSEELSEVCKDVDVIVNELFMLLLENDVVDKEVYVQNVNSSGITITTSW